MALFVIFITYMRKNDVEFYQSS